MKPDYVFTVTAGRSGQNTLTRFLNTHVAGCYAAFEEPKAPSSLPWVFGDFEKRFRRRFIQTHELLGRGKVLTAYESSNLEFIESIVAKRMDLIAARLQQHDARIYVDVSKFFARGLHVGFARAIPEMGLIRLVRDPLMNMRSFLNRNKNFYLDNSVPDASSNILQLDSSEMEKGELYLWAWCEMYLRFDRLIEDLGTDRAVEIRTEDLNDATKINVAFDKLGLEHSPVEVGVRLNRNVAKGLADTQVSAGDIDLFERFLERLAPEFRRRITYLDNYDPRSLRAA